MGRKIAGLLALLLLLNLWGCVTQAGMDPELPEEPASQEADSRPEESAPGDFTPYQAPAFADSAFHSEQAQGESGVLLDLSATAQGEVGGSALGEGRLKVQVLQGETTDTYNIGSDGTPAILPLQSGDGDYTFRVMQEVTEGKYAKLYEASASVALQDPFQPFLRPSQYVPYGENSACVKKAGEIASGQADALGVVDAVLGYICESITYDKELAKTVEKTYLPDPDKTLETGTGICFDYASLAAAMLRSQGIPTKMVFGYVQPDDLYHAWNMFYTQESGWVSVQYEVESNTWNRLDPTFSANSQESGFVGDGTNYTDVYYY